MPGRLSADSDEEFSSSSDESIGKKPKSTSTKKKKKKTKEKKDGEMGEDGKKVGWSKCVAKKLLAEDIINEEITLDTDPDEAFWYRPEYCVTDRTKFNRRLYSLLDQISEAQGRANRDEEALIHDLGLFPRPKTNHRGEPRWEGSAAESWLRIDVQNGVDKPLTAEELRATRLAYRRFPVDVFRGHIHQENRRVKYCTWRNDTKQKKATEWP